MPKSIVVDPKKIRKSGTIEIPAIPVNSYVTDPKKEAKKYGKKRLNLIYQDMLFIREFESMLNSIKTQGAYQGVPYEHKGPAHLSIGQESAAVGQCLNLDCEDFIFGSHRSHGEILAKCFSAIHRLDEKRLEEVMSSYMGGLPLSIVEKGRAGDGSVEDLAVDYTLYGVLAEIFGSCVGRNHDCRHGTVQDPLARGAGRLASDSV